VDVRSGAHEPGTDGGDADAFVAKLCVKALGEADESELAGNVGQKVGNGDFTSDGGDVNDGGGAIVRNTEHVGKRRLCGVEGGEEVGGHGATVGGEGLVFDGADLDDAGVVDEDVDATEVGDGVIDEIFGLGGVGEVGGDEKDRLGGADSVAFEQGVAGGDELVDVAGGEDEATAAAAKAFGEGEAESARAAGDKNDFIFVSTACGGRDKGVGGGCCGQATKDLECGRGSLHGKVSNPVPEVRSAYLTYLTQMRGVELDFGEKKGLKGWAMATKRKSKGAYMISAVAEMYQIHPQTLRLYEREGLLRPSRSEGNTRLYTDEDLERLEFILNLARDLGVNIAGIAVILQMRERMEEMNRQMQGFVDYVRTEMLSRIHQQQGPVAGLVPMRRPVVVPPVPVKKK
jgi:MerR family transcriptional regulator/heat shock protein HspR